MAWLQWGKGRILKEVYLKFDKGLLEGDIDRNKKKWKRNKNHG